ncbi:MAG: DUF2059 domain-containing protein [Pseudomonadota bacterium]
MPKLATVLRAWMMLFLLMANTTVATAQPTQAGRLFDTMRMADIIKIMHLEGLIYGKDLDTDWLSGQGGASWERTVGLIYHEETMIETMRRIFEANLKDVDVEPLITFFETPTGQTVLGLESSAREAFLDETLEDFAKERFTSMEQSGDPRVDQVKALVSDNDYVDRNVVGALNANYAFFEGLVSTLGSRAGQARDMLSNVWAQEPEIRESTTEWLHAYLYMSYQPLDEDQLKAYNDILLTDAGRAATTAMFEGYDSMYVEISRALGRELGLRLSQVDL